MTTQTDRELLELAARAAGIEGDWDVRLTGAGIAKTGECGPVWNPLSQNPDAFELMVKLHIDVESYAESGHVHAHSKYLLGIGPEGYRSYQAREVMTEPLNDDPYAATRRCIVRAAAEIGKRMAQPPEGN